MQPFGRLFHCDILDTNSDSDDCFRWIQIILRVTFETLREFEFEDIHLKNNHNTKSK